jgi:hypothetical protein
LIGLKTSAFRQNNLPARGILEAPCATATLMIKTVNM